MAKPQADYAQLDRVDAVLKQADVRNEVSTLCLWQKTADDECRISAKVRDKSIVPRLTALLDESLQPLVVFSLERPSDKHESMLK